ncbi:MAG: hypothetical protein EZS28_038159 [Streblomastix strix]|uniref:KilA-N domain-containing protein n=1 Tax=Streblomastix strix TaxID=222440 RepID=A0A5J4U7V1_9EUKA|nr:MAG: hypothetical protein EZS28_038159 [Streblomastix strix]
MTAETATPELRKITSNNESFTIGSYNGFEILIRDQDGYVNATKLVQLINEQGNTRKLLKNITSTQMYRDYKRFIQDKSAGCKTSQPTQLEYQLINEYINEVRGTYIHKKLINIICMKTSIKYLDIVTDIMDKINETTIAEHDADKTQAITDQFHNVIDVVTDTLSDRITHLNQQVRQLAPRAVPNGKEKAYILIVEEVNEDELHEEQQEDHITIRVRRINKKYLRPASIERYHHESLLFIDDLPIAMTINEKIKEALQQRQDMKVWSTQYTFPEDQLDEVKRIIQEVIDRRDDV